jgi:hypothetical protein
MIQKKVKRILSSSLRPLPAYYTALYDGDVCIKPKTFDINGFDLSASDEYEMAGYVWMMLAQLELFRDLKNRRIASLGIAEDDWIVLPQSELCIDLKNSRIGTLIIAEDIILGSYLLTKLSKEEICSKFSKKIIDDHLDSFYKKGFDFDKIMSVKDIRTYFRNCQKYGIKLAKSTNEKDNDLSRLGLHRTMDENLVKYYRILKY